MASKLFFNSGLRIGLVLKRNINCNKVYIFCKDNNENSCATRPCTLGFTKINGSDAMTQI